MVINLESNRKNTLINNKTKENINWKKEKQFRSKYDKNDVKK
jgi:hypothetical protein